MRSVAIHRQISDYFETIFLKILIWLLESIQHSRCILIMIETCKKEIDQRKEYGIFLPDLSKAFDCIAGELVIAKLYAYGFSIKILNLVNDY